MCRVLNINESGYYRWCRNSIIPSNRELLLFEIKKMIGECPENENYGIERIRTALEQDGKRYSRRTIYRAMKEGGLLHKKRIPHGITKATDEVQEKENIIKRDFSSSAPVKKVLSDIKRFNVLMESFMCLRFLTATTVQFLRWKCAAI